MLISNGLGTGIVSGIFGWRNNDICNGLSLKNLSIDGITVVSAIGHEGIKSIDLIEQYVQCAGITDRFFSEMCAQRRLACSVGVSPTRVEVSAL